MWLLGQNQHGQYVWKWLTALVGQDLNVFSERLVFLFWILETVFHMAVVWLFSNFVVG